MNGKISCNIIKDLLPLYIDKCLSDDSMKLVEKHIDECEQCKEFLNLLKKDEPKIDIGNEGKIIKSIKKKINKEKVLAIIFSVIISAIILNLVWYMIFVYEKPIAYEDGLITLEQDEENINISFNGNDYYCSYAWSVPLNDESNDVEYYIYFSKTFFTEHLSKKKYNEKFAISLDNVIFDNDRAAEAGHIVKVYYVPLVYSEYIDVLNSNDKQRKELKQNAILLWEERK